MTQSRSQTYLSELLPGDEAIVFGLEAKGAMRHRLLEMGFIRGTCLKVEKFAPMGDPIEIIIKGCHISLRREDCQSVLVVKES
ncbi:MAG: ferrous iron transport protein A [Holophagaceae bacterium]|jgi:Fe2+ transport system protein FeoA|nr:ferrous iron transport protein A [Holophagaceae bacterium]